MAGSGNSGRASKSGSASRSRRYDLPLVALVELEPVLAKRASEARIGRADRLEEPIEPTRCCEAEHAPGRAARAIEAMTSAPRHEYDRAGRRGVHTVIELEHVRAFDDEEHLVHVHVAVR